jgi:hypothetical protein
MLMTLKSFISGATTLLVCATSMCVARAAAGNSGGTQSLVIAKVDVDHDGTLNWNEVSAAASKKFTALDLDRDGALNSMELTGIMTREQFATAETDKDATLSRTEYLAYAKKLFQKADTDNDGTLNSSELSTPAGVQLVSLLSY